MILLLGELLFSLVEIFIRLCQSFPKVPNSENVGLAWYLLVVGYGRWTEVDGSITLPPGMHCGDTVEDLISKIFLTLRGNLTSGFLNVQSSPERMMMLTISTLIYCACSLESKKLCKVLTLW